MRLQPEVGGESAVLNAKDTGICNHLCSPPPALVFRIASTIALVPILPGFLKRDPHGLSCLILEALNCYEDSIK